MNSAMISGPALGSVHTWADVSAAQPPLITPSACTPGFERHPRIGRANWSGGSCGNSPWGCRNSAGVALRSSCGFQQGEVQGGLQQGEVQGGFQQGDGQIYFQRWEFHRGFHGMKNIGKRKKSGSRAGFSKSLALRASYAELSSINPSGGGNEDEAAAGVGVGTQEGKDAFYMRMAADLAKKAVGHTSPNPMVGCVIVKDGVIVGRGFHPKAGEPHAEVFALREAGDNARGATAYVSLEPCNHTGRTPPCSQALVRAKVKRVVVGTVDPNPLVGGQGVQTLQSAGIDVLVGVEEGLCKATAESFFHRITTGKPFLTIRYMMSLDGTLLENLDYGSKAGQHSSLLLQENDAVVITSSCLVESDPALVSEEPGAKQPLRVVLASSLSDLPLDRHVFDTTVAPTVVLIDEKDLRDDEKSSRAAFELDLRSKDVELVVVDGLNLDSLLDIMYQRGFTCVLLDLRGTELFGVQTRLGALPVAQRAAQKVVAVISPVLTGKNRSEANVFVRDDPSLERVSTKIDCGHIIVEGYLPSRMNG